MTPLLLLVTKISMSGGWFAGALFAASLGLLVIHPLEAMALPLLLASSCFLQPGEASLLMLIGGLSYFLLYFSGYIANPILLIMPKAGYDFQIPDWVPSMVARLVESLLADFAIPLQLVGFATAGMLASMLFCRLRSRARKGVEALIALIPASLIPVFINLQVASSYGLSPSYTAYAVIVAASASLGFALDQIFLINERILHAERAASPESNLRNEGLTLSDVGDLEWLKEELYESIVFPLREQKLLKYYKVKPVKGILLFGPPGCGKTLIMRALAAELKVSFIYVRFSDLLSKWYGESERRIADLFRKAREAAPCILFLDELDALGRSRDLYSSDDVAPRLLSMLLSEMDGLDPLEGVIVVAATNAPHLLDPALLRPGRFDKLIYVPPPDERARLEILKVHLRGMPLDADVDLKKLASLTEGFSGADIAMLCQEVARKVALEVARTGKVRKIRMQDFIRVLSKMKPSITPELLQRYEEFRHQFERAARSAE